jgi:hypothetical protein
MATRKISGLCRSVLPAEFEEINRQVPVVQRFLEQNLPEEVSQCVTLLTINQNEIVIAANTPMVANYLRLHSHEIQQQLRETFKLEQVLKFRSIPDAMLKLQKNEYHQEHRQVGPEAIAAIRRNAQWIEDADLQAALLSLAKGLEAD